MGLAVWLMCAGTSQGFSLLGKGAGAAEFPDWQTATYDGLRLDYDQPGDIGGPMRVNEGYRWNVPVIYYAFDQSFIHYFGLAGMNAVDQAIAVFNNLPPMSRIQSDGFSFYLGGLPVPTRTTLINQDAEQLGLLDVKSTAMHMIIEQLGLAEPERYAWALGARDVVNVTPDPDITNYIVFNLNFDPITLRPTNMVNEVLYGYQIFEFDNANIPDNAEALETFDPLSTFPFQSVAGGVSVITVLSTVSLQFFESNAGRFYTGLTHDDIGGLRWLYRRQNLAVENLLTNVVIGTPLAGGGSPWTPFFGGTNVVIGTNFLFNTNLLVREGLRGGIDKLRFQRVNYDSLLGRTFIPITNRYVDTFVTNGQATIQPVQRVINQPDIVFTAERLGLEQNFFPALLSRTGTGNWENNDAINGQDQEVDGGPGVIQGPVVISFTDQLPFFFNSTGNIFLPGGGGPVVPGDQTHIQTVIWGSFDETTVFPIIYPQYGSITLQDLRQSAAGGGN